MKRYLEKDGQIEEYEMDNVFERNMFDNDIKRGHKEKIMGNYNEYRR